jgi:predicted amidophosphoribosyltransferase
LIANRSSMRKARLCRGCGQHVPLGVSSCPSCGRPFV